MSNPPLSEEKRAQARAMFAKGLPNGEIGRRVGCSRETIRLWSQKENWTRDEGAQEARMEERRESAEAASLAAQTKWARRRAQEADAAGIVASRARQSIIQALDERNDKTVRASSIAYGILIDKAQLLSGEATSRIDGTADPKARALAVMDELAERRDRAAG